MMKTAQVINGTVVTYPYPLRPDAKQAHPHFSPLPGSWEQCSPEQLIELQCAVVRDTERPAPEPGGAVMEGLPEFIDGEWRQTWVSTQKPVPHSVPAHHLRRALRQFGMLAGVSAYMSALGEDDEMRESWEYAPYFSRDSLGIEAARMALGLSVEQVDALFVAAGKIVT